MKEQENQPFRQQYKPNEEQQRILDRLIEELRARISVSVAYDLYTENPIITPTPMTNTISFELKVGHWRTIGLISNEEISAANYPNQAFYYFIRRTADRLMMDLIRIGAQRA